MCFRLLHTNFRKKLALALDFFIQPEYNMLKENDLVRLSLLNGVRSAFSP